MSSDSLVVPTKHMETLVNKKCVLIVQTKPARVFFFEVLFMVPTDLA